MGIYIRAHGFDDVRDPRKAECLCLFWLGVRGGCAGWTCAHRRQLEDGGERRSVLVLPRETVVEPDLANVQGGAEDHATVDESVVVRAALDESYTHSLAIDVGERIALDALDVTASLLKNGDIEAEEIKEGCDE